MKRSDAVALVFKALADIEVEKTNKSACLEQADRIVSALEKEGLLPQNPIGTNWYGRWEKES